MALPFFVIGITCMLHTTLHMPKCEHIHTYACAHTCTHGSTCTCTTHTIIHIYMHVHTHLHTLTHTCPHTRCVTSPSGPNFSTHGSGHPHRTCCVITPASGSVKLAEWQLFSHFIDGDANAPGSELTCWSRSHGVTLPCPFLTLENMGQAGGA